MGKAAIINILLFEPLICVSLSLRVGTEINFPSFLSIVAAIDCRNNWKWVLLIGQACGGYKTMQLGSGSKEDKQLHFFFVLFQLNCQVFL